jgi:hypothetical protein
VRNFRFPASCLLLLLPSCGAEPDPKTLEGAFSRMAEAAEQGSPPALFASLDDDSRGSVSSIHHAQREAKELVERDYPPAERGRATGRWRIGADARDATGTFVAWCEETDCVPEVRDRLSSIVRTVTHGDRARVKVRRGREYPFARSKQGRWGLALFQERLARWKTEVHRDLDAIRRAAEIYRRGSS